MIYSEELQLSICIIWESFEDLRVEMERKREIYIFPLISIRASESSLRAAAFSDPQRGISANSSVYQNSFLFFPYFCKFYVNISLRIKLILTREATKLKQISDRWEILQSPRWKQKWRRKWNGKFPRFAMEIFAHKKHSKSYLKTFIVLVNF